MAKAIRASVLVLLFACSAQAGWIQNGVTAPPPPQPTSAEQEQTAAQAALNLLLNVLALF